MSPTLECLPEPLRFGRLCGNGTDSPFTIDWTQRADALAADARPEGRPEQGWTTAAAYNDALGTKLGRAERNQKVRDYNERLRIAVLKIIAGALGVPLGVLTQRDKAHQLAVARRRARTARWIAIALLMLTITAATAAVIAWIQRNKAEQETAAKQKMLEEASWSSFNQADRLLAERKPDWLQAIALFGRAVQFNPSNRVASERFEVSPTKVRKVPQDSCQLPGRKGFSAFPELPRRDLV